MKIFIVEDDDGIAEEMKAFFEEEGYEVCRTDGAFEGMRDLGKVRPDFLIVDLKLPDGSGLMVLRECKIRFKLAKTAVITGYMDPNLLERAAELQPDLILHKPFDLLFLKSEMDRVYSRPPKRPLNYEVIPSIIT